MAGCVTGGAGSRDPRHVRLVERGGFRLAIVDGCLDGQERRALLTELETARVRIRQFVGAALAPGDFRAYGEPRASCPGERATVPSIPTPIDVVVVPEGGRCHADEHGVTLVASHLSRRDATHELVHYLAGSSWRPLDEGLAVYLTERFWGPAADIPVKIRARAYHDLDLDVDLDPEVLRRDGMSRRDYDVAGAFVGWLIEAYGAAKFWELYAGPVRNYHGVYRRSEAELWERFWRYVRNLDVRHDGRYHAYKDRYNRG